MRIKEHVAEVLNAAEQAAGYGPPPAGYIVYSGSYHSNSAGVYCLHKLCDELNRRGFPSFTTGGDVGAPDLNAPMIDESWATALCSHGFIAVYPETIRGNPLGARHVVRWVLNRPGLLGGDKVYDDSELVFSYSNVFSPYIKNRLAGKLYMPTIDQSLFYCDDSDLAARNLNCFYVGKSNWKEGCCDPFRSYEITRRSPEKPELGKLFRASKMLYCFDNSTILIYEALLCGCPVTVIPDGTQTKADFEQLELGVEGITWGRTEGAPEPVDVAKLESRLRSIREQFDSQLEHLISRSQSQVEQAIDWNNQSFSTVSWRREPRLAIYIAKRRVTRKGRQLERVVRLSRRRALKQLREWLSSRRPIGSDTSQFYCDDWRLSNRRLVCYWSHDRTLATDDFDPKDAFPVSPAISDAQLGNLFRASRRFYTSDPPSHLVDYALACGCPVTLLSDSHAARHIEPQPNGSSAHAHLVDAA